MYTQQHLDDINHQLKRRMMRLLLPQLVLLAGLVYSLVIRSRWLTTGLFILMGALALFYWGLVLSPLRAYRKYLCDLLGGRQREYAGQFRGFDGHEVIRDNVRFMPFMLNVGNAEDLKDDRLLYWDTNLPLPDWREGEHLWVNTFDKAVTGWRQQDAAQPNIG